MTVEGSASACVELPISGMSCTNCANAVASALRLVPGVREVNVSFATDSATVWFDPQQVRPANLLEAVRRAGYEVPASRVELAVVGMSCANCARTIERAVARLPGVVSAEASFAAERLSVAYIPALVRLSEVIAAVRRAGYDVPTDGDAIAPELPDAEQAARAAELTDKRRRMWVGLAFGAPLLVLSMGRDLGLWGLGVSGHGGHRAGDDLLFDLLLLALALPVQLYTGWQYYARAAVALRNRAANMDVLVSLGATAAFLWSLAVMLGWVSGHVYFETAALIVALVSVGKYLEARAKRRTGDAIHRLLALTPPVARVHRGEQEVELPLSQLSVGDVFVVRAGERVPADGVVIGGRAVVDESMVTGESVPKEKQPGDRVVGGSLNVDGLLRCEATRVGRQTLLAQIARAVAQAQRSRAPVQMLVDRVSAVFVPIVALIALLTAIAWLLLSGDAQRAVVNAVAVLVVACPCALGLATPTAMMVGMGRAAELGVLFRDSAALEQVAAVKTVVFDKTGTLTHGRPTIAAMVGAEAASEAEVLQWAATAEQASSHPLAQSIVQAARQRGLPLQVLRRASSVPGRGVIAEVISDEGRIRRVIVGSERLASAEGVALGQLANEAARLQQDGYTVIIVAVDGRAVGLIGTRDELRPEAHGVVNQLLADGVQVVMLTGDQRAVAQRIAEQLGLRQVVAEVLPTEKAEQIRLLQREQRGVVAMVGDGVNDAPALAQADVGIAISTGSDVAIEAAHVTLVRPDLWGVVDAIAWSRHTRRGVRQNLFWAFFYNVLLIPLASAGVFQQYGPILAAAAMAFSSLFVMGNSLRLRRMMPTKREAGLAP
ncbi:MAG: heavy metal translocating P-type ATPase [Thermoflexales bacterium]